MPWTNAVDQRYAFVRERLRGDTTMTALCERYGISRRVGYKWLGRFEAGGRAGLEDLPRTPHSSQSAVSAEVEEALLSLKVKHLTWGAKKLRSWLEKNEPGLELPSVRTVGRFLKRRGLIDEAVSVRAQRASSRKQTQASRTLAPCTKPNDVWCVDFKGDFRLGDQSRCYPVTITDNFTRYLIACRARSSTHLEGVKLTLQAAFRKYGLPKHVRSDNGPPFGGDGVLGLSYLSVWMIRLGVEPEHIAPGRPDQNGRHERMHRTLKAEAARPPRQSLRAQQRALNKWREIYNNERPHEALEFSTPGELYLPSSREIRAPESPDYPGYYEVRKVRAKGCFRWRGTDVFVGEAFRGEPVGLREVDDQIWIVSYGSRDLGVLNEWDLHPTRHKLAPLEGWK